MNSFAPATCWPNCSWVRANTSAAGRRSTRPGGPRSARCCLEARPKAPRGVPTLPSWTRGRRLECYGRRLRNSRIAIVSRRQRIALAVRPGEASQAWSRAVIQIPASKTAAGIARDVPMHRMLFDAMSEWWSRHPDDRPEALLFPTATGRQRDRNNIRTPRSAGSRGTCARRESAGHRAKRAEGIMGVVFGDGGGPVPNTSGRVA
jgi:hypothetical protein